MHWLRQIFSNGDTSLRRSVVAFVVAPLIASYLFSALMIGRMAVRDSVEMGEAIGGILFGSAMATALVGWMMAYAGMAAVGLPAWLALRFTNLEGTVSYALAGALGGALFGPHLLIPPIFGDRPAANGAAAGLMLMILFWWIARRRIHEQRQTTAC